MDLFEISDARPSVDDVPRSVYASLDEIPLVDEQNGTVLFEFSAIEKRGFDSISRSAKEWQTKWSERMRGQQSDLAGPMFANMQFVNFEISLPLQNISAKRWLRAWGNTASRGNWYEMELVENAPQYLGKIQVLAYPNLFSGSLTFGLKTARKITGSVASGLRAAFNMKTWPSATAVDIRNALKHADAGVLAVHDIGQGNACGLRRSTRSPINLWIDIGCGVNRNAKTTPINLVLCHSASAPIILTHWDKDHWSGARKGAPASKPNIFLKRIWIVPRQEITTQHSKFADEIIAAHGTILVLDSTSLGASKILSVPIRDNRKIEIALGAGANSKDRNNYQCLVLRIIDDDFKRKWLLPGDITYGNMPTGWQKDAYVAIVASHHGADVGAIGLPGPYNLPEGYAVLAFSFGPQNAHGPTGVRHPTHAMTAHYNKSGWGLDCWLTAGKSAEAAPGLFAVSTAQHSPATGMHLGGKLIGWEGAPPTCGSKPPCGSRCTATLG